MKQHRMNKYRWVLPALFGLLAIVTTAIIFYNSSQVGTDSEALSHGVRDGLNSWLAQWGIGGVLSNHIVRKTAHFLEFMLLGLLLALCLGTALKRCWRFFWLPVAVGFAVACMDETIQLHVPGRAGRFSDVLIDLSGVVAGTALGLLIIYLVRRRKSHRQIKKK